MSVMDNVSGHRRAVFKVTRFSLYKFPNLTTSAATTPYTDPTTNLGHTPEHP